MDSQDLYDFAVVCANNVHPATIMKIVDTESNRNRFAVNVNGIDKVFEISSLKQALAVIELANREEKSYDVGLMQINSKNLELFGIKPKDAFEPCLNLRLGSVIISEFYKSALKTTNDPQVALQRALSGYNTGDFDKGFANGYVGKYYQEVDAPEKPADPVESSRPPWGDSGKHNTDLSPNTEQSGGWNEFLGTNEP